MPAADLTADPCPVVKADRRTACGRPATVDGLCPFHAGIVRRRAEREATAAAEQERRIAAARARFAERERAEGEQIGSIVAPWWITDRPAVVPWSKVAEVHAFADRARGRAGDHADLAGTVKNSGQAV